MRNRPIGQALREGATIRMLVLPLAFAAAAFFIAGLSADALAAGGKSKKDLELFKTSCKACHAKSADMDELSPSSLIQDQWTRFFEKKFEKTHSQLVHPVKKKPLGELLSKESVEKLEKFLVKYAADSEQPMTCGE